MGADACGFAPQLRHRLSVDEVVAGRHFGENQPGPEGCGQAAKRRIRDARHGGQKNPASKLNITYFQWVMVQRVEPAHGFLVAVTGAVTRRNRLLRTNLGQSSFMPTL